MRFSNFIVAFILLIPVASASWQTYQNDIRNTGKTGREMHSGTRGNSPHYCKYYRNFYIR